MAMAFQPLRRSGVILLALVASGCAPMTASPTSTFATPLYDTHAHLFSSDIARYPIDTSAAAEGPDVLRARILAHPATPEVLLPLWSTTGVTGGAAVQYNSAYRTDNSYLLDSAAGHSDRIAPVVILDAQQSDTPALLRSLVQKRGVVALRLTGGADRAGGFPWLSSPAARETWAEVNRLGMVMVIMYLPRRPSDAPLKLIGDLARQYPNVRIVLDHAGWLSDENAPALGLTEAHLALRDQQNVYFKITSINFDSIDEHGGRSADVVRRLADVYGAHRLMWGSDYGNTPGAYPDMARRARESTAKLTERERRQFLQLTGQSLFAARPPPR